MDDTADALAEALQGQSKEEIAAMISSSTNAASFQDPDLVAAYLASKAS